MTRNDPLAEAAAEPIASGMAVGLGTGRAASRGIVALGERASRERLDLRCVATSRASQELARSLGLSVGTLEEIGPLDYMFDGADEVDPLLRMIKGRGGAMTREKIVAHAARRRVYLVQSAKLSTRLGQTAPLPIEVQADRASAVLTEVGLPGTMRRATDGRPYLTDGGHPVIDVALAADVDLAQLAARLDALPGVVGHGLFLNEADEVLVEDTAGHVTRHSR